MKIIQFLFFILFIYGLSTIAEKIPLDNSDDYDSENDGLEPRMLSVSDSEPVNFIPLTRGEMIMDISVLNTAFQDIEKVEQKWQQWDTRLAAARKNNEVQSILKEQVEAYQNLENKLKGLKTRGWEIHRSHVKWFEMVSLIRGELQKMQQLNFEKPIDKKKAMETMIPNIQKYVLELESNMKEYGNFVYNNLNDFGMAKQAIVTNDISLLIEPFKNVEAVVHKQQQWETKFVMAQKAADMQAMLKEQIEVYQRIENELKKIKTLGSESNKLHMKWLQGVSSIHDGLQMVQKLNFENLETLDSDTKNSILNTTASNLRSDKETLTAGVKEFRQLVEQYGTDEQKKAMKAIEK